MMNLTDTAIKALKPTDRRFSVGDGNRLWLEVFPTGGKTWYVRYTLNGKPERVQLGAYPDVSLKDARGKRDAHVSAVAAGKSPAAEKRLKKQALSALSSVEEFGKQHFFPERAAHLKDSTALKRYLDKDIYPFIGSKAVKDVTPAQVMDVVRRKKDNGHAPSASKVQAVLHQLFNHARFKGLLEHNPVDVLPRRFLPKARERTRHLDRKEIRSYLVTIRESNIRTQFKLALHLLLITMVRKSELLLARWDEVDLDESVWTIPARNAKNKKSHVVYLSTQAVELFKKLKELATGSELVMPGRSSLKQPFASNALNGALKGISFTIDAFWIHDLRRTASTLLHENAFPSDVIEKALSHTLQGVRGVYNKAEYAEERRKMLQWWADFVDTAVAGENVVKLQPKAA